MSRCVFSKCCNPIPGDEIVGFITRGRGVSIHRTDCVNVIHMSEEDRARLIEAEWQVPEGETSKALYSAEISVYATNRTGLVVDISRIFTERKIDIGSMSVRTTKQGTATIEISFTVHSVDELNELIDRVRTIESVMDIERKTG
jgi:guanosine-3',5'-bis(diphosphate) 3'-pyrophosphohydrolase